MVCCVVWCQSCGLRLAVETEPGFRVKDFRLSSSWKCPECGGSWGPERPAKAERHDFSARVVLRAPEGRPGNGAPLQALPEAEDVPARPDWGQS
jgi:transposase-like protein